MGRDGSRGRERECIAGVIIDQCERSQSGEVGGVRSSGDVRRTVIGIWSELVLGRSVDQEST